MDKPILIIIDMQYQFPASQKRETILAVQELIRNAIRSRNSIVVVEYIGAGQTLSELTSLLNTYDLTSYIKKGNDDGSREIEGYFKKCRIVPKELIVCGVNTDACVLSTVISLSKSKNKYKITIKERACNTDWSSGDKAFSTMKKNAVQVL